MTITGSNVLDGYKLKDVGYADIKWIYHRQSKIGHVGKKSEGDYQGKIGDFVVRETTEEGAYRAVLAIYLGMSIQDISRYAMSGKGQFQIQTEAIIDFLKRNSVENDGRLTFTNDDLAAILGGEDYKRALGNLISRLDFACYAVGLPPLGCAAAEPFPNAWMDRKGRTWSYPRDAMCRGAKAHRWTDADFEKLRNETCGIQSGRARAVWDDEMGKHEAKIRDWAFGPASDPKE
jgi:hypothetical protein